MKRFYFGDENENDDEDENENDETFEDPEFFQMAQFPMPIESEGSIIDSSIRICESCLFWRFYSIEFKLKKIKETYFTLQSIIDDELERKKNA